MADKASAAKIALITGGARGVGLATAEKLCERGYHVILTSRSQSGADEAVARVRHKNHAASVEGRALDLASHESVRALGKVLSQDERRLDLLIQNAGLLDLNKQLQRSADGNEMMFAANYLGHFLLTHLLLPRLLRSAPARVVVVSSRWHMPGARGPEVNFDFDNLNGEKSYDPEVFYKNSKLANMWFTYELARRLDGSGVTVNAVCPGWVPSTLAEHQSGIQSLLSKYFFPLFPAAHSPQTAADNTVFAATDPLYEARSGRFIGECQEVPSSEESHDQAKAARLWRLSCKLCQIPEDAVATARAT